MAPLALCLTCGMVCVSRKEAPPTGALAELADGSYWHLTDNPAAPAHVRDWTKADEVEF